MQVKNFEGRKRRPKARTDIEKRLRNLRDLHVQKKFCVLIKNSPQTTLLQISNFTGFYIRFLMYKKNTVRPAIAWTLSQKIVR